MCKVCHKAKLVQQGKHPLKLWEWKEVLGKKAHRGRLWKVFGSEPLLRGMWEQTDSRGRCSGKTRRKARSVATGAFLQKTFCAYSAVTLGNWESFEEEWRREAL